MKRVKLAYTARPVFKSVGANWVELSLKGTSDRYKTKGAYQVDKYV
jgi:hypothetical protein